MGFSLNGPVSIFRSNWPSAIGWRLSDAGWLVDCGWVDVFLFACWRSQRVNRKLIWILIEFICGKRIITKYDVIYGGIHSERPVYAEMSREKSTKGQGSLVWLPGLHSWNGNVNKGEGIKSIVLFLPGSHSMSVHYGHCWSPIYQREGWVDLWSILVVGLNG